MKKPLKRLARQARLTLQEFGPYMALLMLPGGSVIALSAWLYDRRHANTVRT